VNDLPPAEILRRARPIPTYRDHPATSPADIEGVTPAGEPVKVEIVDSTDAVLLVFLSSSCLGCRDLWEGTAALRQSLPAALRLILVTRGPDHEDVEAIAALGPADTPTVMSSQAFRDYRVSGPPFLVVVFDGAVQTEGVAWGIAETVRATRAALGGHRDD
jgi:hypothetical protein